MYFVWEFSGLFPSYGKFFHQFFVIGEKPLRETIVALYMYLPKKTLARIYN